MDSKYQFGRYKKPKREIDKAYRKYIESQPCLIGFGCLGDIISHHTKSVGSGGSDYTCVPLCMKHHNEVHTAGRDMFQTRYGISFEKEIERLLGKKSIGGVNG
jgi:Protein of unknown function (DUF968).